MFLGGGMSSALKTVLSDFTRIEGVRGACIISKDGFMVESVMPVGGIDPDALAAMIVTLFGTAVKMGEELKMGSTELVTIEFMNNYVLIEDLGDVVFTVIAERAALLGRIRYEMKRQKDRVRAAL